MSLGKMNTTIKIVSKEPIKDSEGFASDGEILVATVKAYFEQKNSSEKWSNLSEHSDINALFRLRLIPNLKITTSHYIICNEKCYDIYSVENVRNKNMYLEILAVSRDG